MNIPQETISQIKAEAVAYANDMPFFNGSLEQGYTKGATEWVGKAQGLVDALVKLNSAIDKTWNECNTKSIPDKYKKEIAAAQAQCGNALAKYKEVTNG